MKPIVITGATGLLGKKIVALLHKKNYDVIIFSRSPQKAKEVLPYAQEYVRWNAEENGDWAKYIDGAYGVINLAGTNVGEGRWTEKKKKEIYDSRIVGTRGIVNAILQADNPPKVLVNTSASGFYGNSDIVQTEEQTAASDFLAQVCNSWEAEAQKASSVTRVVCPRVGVVLDANEGALAKLSLPFKMFTGVWLGSGKQWMPWIHRDDVARIFVWALDEPRLQGAINAVAPNPVTMKQLAKSIGKTMHRPLLAPVPEFALKLLLGEQHSIVTGGNRLSANKALSLGFTYNFPVVEDALKDLLQ